MTNRFLLILVFAVAMTIAAPAVSGQTEDAARVRTREQLESLLDKVGPTIKVSFRRSEKQPFNYVGVMQDGLTSADGLEIVISVSTKQTIHFRIFPHYAGSYLNVDKAKNGVGLMRQMLRFSDSNFLFWGIDGSADIFAGYNFTLESGFPEAAITIVLRSISNLDKFIGDMKPVIDGSAAAGQ